MKRILKNQLAENKRKFLAILGVICAALIVQAAWDPHSTGTVGNAYGDSWAWVDGGLDTGSIWAYVDRPTPANITLMQKYTVRGGADGGWTNTIPDTTYEELYVYWLQASYSWAWEGADDATDTGWGSLHDN